MRKREERDGERGPKQSSKTENSNHSGIIKGNRNK